MEAFEKIQLSFKCPKALDELQPCESNWYCDGCRKMVYDFRGMEEAQILDAFAQSGQKLCGIYDADRIKVLPQQPRWFGWAAMALVLVGLNACKKSLLGESNITKVNTTEEKAPVDSAINDIPLLGFAAIEIQPSFPGGEEAWAKYLREHIKFDKDWEYTGRVFAEFIVERDGRLTNIKIVKGGVEGLNEEIIDVLKKSPRWNPGVENGKTQRTSYTMPFNFCLSE